MQAMILAAGAGRRLRDPRPKCLVTVGGVSLVEHQLSMLAAAGVTDVVVVVGHAADLVRSALGDRVRYVANHAFATTNSLYSFLLGSRGIRDDTLVLNCDVFLHPKLLERLADAQGDALLYDSGSGQDEEHMKVRIRDGRLVDMDKKMPPQHVSGENVGVLRLRPDTVAAVARAGSEILAAGGRTAWLGEAVSRVSPAYEIGCHDVASWPWVEIDFPEDLVRAETEVYPDVAHALEGLPGPFDVAAHALTGTRRNA